MIPNAGEILHPPATDQHNGMLLEVMPYPGDIGGDLISVRQADSGNFSQSGVGLLGSGSVHPDANPSPLRGIH